MTDIEFKVLDLLHRAPGQSCTNIGCSLMRTKQGRMPQAYARPAGVVLRRLEKQKLVRWGHEGWKRRSGGRRVWYITKAGRDEMRKAIRAAKK